MKALEKMSNWERAKLLATLFPQEIPGILDAIRQHYRRWVDFEQQVRENWDNGIITPDFWYGHAGEAHKAVQRHGAKLATNQRLFADQLFDGFRTLFTIDCLHYHTAQGGGCKKFRQAVELLFGDRGLFSEANEKVLFGEKNSSNTATTKPK